MEYRIEQLARSAGVAVDTIRFYQGKGLLTAPRREGRVTWYTESHLERLRRIKELQQQGFTLTVIQRFLTGELERSDEALVAAVTRPAAPQTLTLSELAERSGVAEPLLMSLEQAGLLVPVEGGDEPLFPADDLEAIAAGMKLIAAGVPLGALMELGKEHAAACRRPLRPPRARADPVGGRHDRGCRAPAARDVQRAPRGKRNLGQASLRADAAARRARAHRETLITSTSVRTWELDRTPDLVDLVSAARDSGHEVLLIERPMPDAVSIAALGKAFDLVAGKGGVALEDASGKVVDFEAGDNQLQAASRLWRRVCESLRGPIAVGGFAYRPDREPGGPWSGFPALLLRVPALAVTRVRGRTYATAATPDADALLELNATGVRAPAARKLQVTPVRNPVAWTAAVGSASARLRAGDAAKVVLAREMLARGDGVVSAAMVARSLRAAYPSCFTYLITGADGTAFAGASPELLIRRSGNHAFAQPMAGSVARGATDTEDERLAG